MISIAQNNTPQSPPRQKLLVFKKRQKGAKLWNRFYSTYTMPPEDADRIIADLRVSNPTMEFDKEVAAR